MENDLLKIEELFFKLSDTMSLEELMEVKGGNEPPVRCESGSYGYISCTTKAV